MCLSKTLLRYLLPLILCAYKKLAFARYLITLFCSKFFCFTSCSIKLWYDSHESISEIMIQGFLIRLSNLLSNINLSAFAVGELRTHEKIFCNFHCTKHTWEVLTMKVAMCVRPTLCIVSLCKWSSSRNLNFCTAASQVKFLVLPFGYWTF